MFLKIEILARQMGKANRFAAKHAPCVTPATLAGLSLYEM